MEEEQKAVASEEPTEVSGEQKPEASQAPGPDVQEEFQRKVQSEADKRAKVFEQKLRDLETKHRLELQRIQDELESERRAAEVRREEMGVETFLNKYVAEGSLPEGSVPPIRDFAKGLYERDRKLRELEVKAKETLRKAEEKEQEITDTKAMRDVLKVAKNAGVSVTYDEAEEIAKKTKGNLDWVSDILEGLKSKAVKPPTETAKPQPKRPDSSASTAPGGGTTDNELRRKYAMGEISTEKYEEECKSRGMRPAYS